MSKSYKVHCFCGESISQTAEEILNYGDVECPNCGSDVSLEEVYDEVLEDSCKPSTLLY